MKRFSLIFLILIGLNSYSQNSKEKEFLTDILPKLPDSTFNNHYSKFQGSDRALIWSSLKKEEYEIIKNSTFYEYDGAELNIKNTPNLNLINFLVNWEKGIFWIFDNRSDVSSEYEIKVFKINHKYIVAFTVKHSTFSTYESGGIEFFVYSENKLKNITKDVLNSFNFYTDNYNESIIDSLNLHCDCNHRNNVTNEGLLYRFTTSDTVVISDNFFGYFYNGYPNPGLDSTYFDGQFYTKKYIMDNGKLRLAE